MSWIRNVSLNAERTIVDSVKCSTTTVTKKKKKKKRTEKPRNIAFIPCRPIPRVPFSFYFYVISLSNSIAAYLCTHCGSSEMPVGMVYTIHKRFLPQIFKLSSMVYNFIDIINLLPCCPRGSPELILTNRVDSLPFGVNLEIHPKPKRMPKQRICNL